MDLFVNGFDQTNIQTVSSIVINKYMVVVLEHQNRVEVVLLGDKQHVLLVLEAIIIIFGFYRPMIMVIF